MGSIPDSKRNTLTLWLGVTFALFTACGTGAIDSPPRAGSNLRTRTAALSCATPPAFAGVGTVRSGQATTCTAQLSWTAATASCGGAITYSVYRDTVSGFTPSDANRIASGLTATSFNDNLNLQDNQTYWYVVRATETAASAIEESNTNTVPVHIAGPSTPAIRYFDDFDSNRPSDAGAYWSSDGGTFAIVNAADGGVDNAYEFPVTQYGYYPPDTDAWLVVGGDGTVPGIDGFQLPSRVTRVSLSCSLSGNVEGGYDFLNLESRVGASGTWTLLQTWTGSLAPATYTFSAQQLKQSAGQPLWMGWHFTSDSVVEFPGFYLDNVKLDVDQETACTTYVPPPGAPATYVIDGVYPSTPVGGPVSITIKALDSAGVLVSGYSGPANLSTSDPQATLSTPVTFTNGVASATLSFATLGMQSITLQDSADPQLSVSVSTSVVAAPDHLVVVSQPTTVTAGVPFGSSLQVGLYDAAGNRMSTGGVAVSIALTTNPTGDTLTGTLTQLTASGVATFRDLSLTRAGVGEQLTATVSGVPPVTTAPIQVTAAAPAALAWTVQPSKVGAGQAFAPAPQVAVVDAFGNQTSSSANVTLSLAPNGGALTGTATRPASAGVASFPDLGVTKPGTGYVLAAASSGLTGANSGAFDVTSGPPDHLRFTAQPSSTSAGAPISPAVAVSVFDAFENPVDQPTVVRISLGSNPGQTSLSGTLQQTTASGVASFDDLAIDRAGQGYSLYATELGLTAANSVAFDVTPAVARGLSFSGGPPSTVVAGAPFAVQVAITDALGNPISTGAPVTISLSLQGGAGTLGGTATADTVNGIAMFTGLSLSQVGSGLTLQASGSGFVASSAAFSVVSAAASVLSIVPAGAPEQGQPVMVTVTARDAFGNPARDDQRTVTFTSSDSKAQLPAPVPLYDGRAQATVVFGSSGAQTITVSDVQDPSVTGTQAITVAPVAAPTVTLLTPQSGATLSGTVTVVASATVGTGTSVSSLTLLVDGAPLKSGQAAVLSASWDTMKVDASKAHVLVAKVVDGAGNSATSAPVSVKVAAPASGCSVADGPSGAMLLVLMLLGPLLPRRRRLRVR